MTKNTLNTSSDAPKKTPAKSTYIATAALFFIVLFLWRDSANMKADVLLLTEQNTELQKELKERSEQMHAKLAKAQSDLAHFKASIPQKSTKKPNARVIEKPKPVEYPETLLLQTPEISQTPDGLLARIHFQSTLSEPPGLLALVVRIPRGSEAVIQGFNPVDETAYTDVNFRINESGKFAIFQGNPIHLNALEFNLTVSAPVTATIRGTEGIQPFEIDIDPSNPSVRKL
jgi:hypothetical protein